MKEYWDAMLAVGSEIIDDYQNDIKAKDIEINKVRLILVKGSALNLDTPKLEMIIVD